MAQRIATAAFPRVFDGRRLIQPLLVVVGWDVCPGELSADGATLPLRQVTWITLAWNWIVRGLSA